MEMNRNQEVPVSTLRIVSLDEIRARQDEIWSAPCAIVGGTVSNETKRNLRSVFRMTECITNGFAPLAWDTARGLLFSHRAMCLECGHVVAVRQPSWMRKHNATKHNRTERLATFSSLLNPTEAS